jgi:hypothetical protein
MPVIAQFKHIGESRTTIIRCFIPSLVMFFQQATGTNAINTYSPTIFASLGVTGTSSGLFATGIYGVVKTIAVALVLAFAVEGMGRKMCLLVGGAGQGLMMLWIAGYSAIHPQATRVAASYVSLVAVYLYAVFYCIGKSALTVTVGRLMYTRVARPWKLTQLTHFRYWQAGAQSHGSLLGKYRPTTSAQLPCRSPSVLIGFSRSSSRS